MKIPLKYQSTEYDCGPTTLMNAINFLFDRENIPPEVLRYIMLYSLDMYNKDGEAGKEGTSGMAMEFIANWLNHYGKIKDFEIHCERLTGRSVYIGQSSAVTECLQNNGAVIAKVMLDVWHYVLLTGIDQESIYLFDPYYCEKPCNKKSIQLILDKPMTINRKVDIAIINRQYKRDYALGPLLERECVLMFNTKTRRTMDHIEYII